MFKSKDLLVPLQLAAKKDDEDDEPADSGCCSVSCINDGDGDGDNGGGCKKSKKARGDSFGPAGLAMLRRQMAERLAESLAPAL